MCGIAGIFHFNGMTSYEKEQIGIMLSKIEHRGPDSSGVYTDNKNICVGSVRLSMTDSQSEINYLSNEDESIILVFNGEIYNHKELRLSLENKGHVFKTGSDGEVITHLYEEKGIDCLKELDGMFACALWDSYRKVLFLARDPIGIKPLYYKVDKERVIFASELKAICSICNSPLVIDITSLSSYFHYRFVTPPRTIFQNIFKIEPGSFLVAQNGLIHKKKFWEITFGKECGNSGDSFYDILKESIVTTTSSDHKIGLFLSGGLDSSGILAMYSALQSNIPTFTIGYESDCGQDEGHFAATLSGWMNSQHEYRKIINKEVSHDLRKVLWHLDEPLYSTISLSTYSLSKMASKKVKGVLTGDGADELLLGYSYLLKALNIFKSGGDWKQSYLRQIGWMTGNWLERLAKAELIEEREDLLQVFGSENPFDAMRYFEIKYRLPEYHLSRVDRLSMAHGLEARLPFLRKKVVEHLLKYSSDILLVPGKQKKVFRDAFSRFLPTEFIERKKQSFTAPFIEWLEGPLKEEVHDLLLGSSYHNALYIKKKGVEDVVQNCYHGDGSAFSVLWGLFNIYKWYESFKNDKLSL